MKLQTVLDKVIFSKAHEWHHIRPARFVREQFCLRISAVEPAACDSSDGYAPGAHTDHAVLTSDVGITLAWGLTAAGEYHEPWAMRCPNPSAWAGYFDIAYRGTLLHRDVYVSVDGDRCYLPMPRNLEDLRVAGDYAQVTRLLSALSLDSRDSDFGIYVRRTGLVLADEQWPR